MTTVFFFTGGSLDLTVMPGDTERIVREGAHAFAYYRSTHRGELGRQFTVNGPRGAQIYEIVKRSVSSRCLYLRAQLAP